MNRTGGFLVNQSKALLANRLYALLCIALFTVLPFTTWLATAVIALVTLRKGEEAGLQGLVVALTLNTVQLIKWVPSPVALVSSLLAFVPCFIAASVLRNTSSWRLALGSLFFQAALGVWVVQSVAPDLIPGQLLHIKTFLLQYQDMANVGDLLNQLENSGNEVNQTVLAHLLFIFQIVVSVIMTLLSLLIARNIQARCFNPGGFKKEMLAFRSGKVALFLLLVLGIAAYYQVWLAIDLLPLVLFYFLAAGFTLSCFMLTGKRFSGFMLLLLASLLIKPIIMFPVYIIFGSLDSLFNFRVYLLARAGKSV